jgi:hypothetical protein
VQGVALGQQQHPVQFRLLVAVQLHLDDRLTVDARQIHVFGVFDDFGRGAAVRIAEHPVAVVQVAVQFHVADGDEAVEPGVGHRFHRLLESMECDPLLQSFPFGSHRLGECPPADHGHVVLLGHRLDLLLGQAVECRSIRDHLDEFTSSQRGVGFQFVAVHGVGPLSVGLSVVVSGQWPLGGIKSGSV